jgi:hypothetical protein
MKQCPSCGATYADDGLNFCLSDGTRLNNSGAVDPEETRIRASTPDSSATLVIPSQTLPPTRASTQEPRFNPQTNPQERWSAPQGFHQPVAEPQQRKSKAPWVVAGTLATIAVLAVAGVIVALAVKYSGNSNEASTNNSKPGVDTLVSPSPRPGKSASGNEGSATNTAATPSEESSPNAPFAELSGRTGHYEGYAINTTFSPPSRGTMSTYIDSINEDTGATSMRFKSGGNLCGDGPATGRFNSEGVVNLTGRLVCQGYTFPMAATCRFTNATTMACNYTLTSPPGITPAAQRGIMEVSKK